MTALCSIYDSTDGGLGLMIASIIRCESVTRIAIAIIDRKKGK